MLNIGVVTLFPELVRSVIDYGVTGRAVTKNVLRLSCWNPRDYTNDRHRTVDDRPYGGGPGMVMLFEPLRRAIAAAKDELGDDSHVLALTPQGQRLDQAGVARFASFKALLIVAGRYEGIDERIMDVAVDEECSIGDYVLSGGELAAMVLIDAIARTLPGCLGHAQSAAEDSFAAGLLDCPHYTRPEMVEGLMVPEVLLSGDHQAIRRWRLMQSLGRTWVRRRDLLQDRDLTREEVELLTRFLETENLASGPDTNKDSDK